MAVFYFMSLFYVEKQVSIQILFNKVQFIKHKLKALSAAPQVELFIIQFLYDGIGT